ncbi:MAG TPA: TonB C-terminal domain-containing protein [Candidatus Obscuribacterales bacterium]
MATDLNQTSSLQALADSTGLIIDRALFPEKVVGQCWLISKGRVVCLASAIANYTESPWALQVKFPHPELNFAVRTVTVHPDFNKREARDYYLSQTKGPLGPLMLENDIATMALDNDLAPPKPERIAELNRALAIPFDLGNQDMSGTMRSGDVPAIIQSVLSTGRSGLLTFIDARNVPVARLQIRQTKITRVNFQALYNELAFCELLWRQPPGSFAFQPMDYRWPPDVPEMQTTTEQLIAEAQRRFDELPHIFDMLGGFDARYSKQTPLADFSQIMQTERWLAERIWECLDGYLTLNKLPERVGSDTYSAMKMVWDLATMGLLAPNQNPPFHGNGQLGPLLVPATDLELSTWDGLTAFYLDPLSGNPVSMSGNFFGGAHAISNKTMLHTTAVPANTMGAILLKDGKLVGLHTGPNPLRGATNPPPIPLQRMMWIGALNDLGSKRLRSAEVAAAEAAEAAEAQEQAVSKSSLRIKQVAQQAAEEAKLKEEEETGPLAKYSKQQIAAAAAVVAGLGLVMMIGSLVIPRGASAPPQAVTEQPKEAPAPIVNPTAVTTGSGPANDPKLGDVAAQKEAFDMMGLVKPPDAFLFKDSSKLTDPKRSFQLVSDEKNVEITYIEWPNQSILVDPTTFVKHTVLFNMFRNNDQHDEFTGNLPHVRWFGNHYSTGDDYKAHIMCTIGMWDAGHDGKAMMFIARPLNGDVMPDLEYPANLSEKMISSIEADKAAAAAKAKSANAGQSDADLAKPEELAAYRKQLEDAIKNNYKPPKFDVDTDTKTALKLTVDPKGQVKDLSWARQNPNEDFNNALQKAVDQSKPWPVPPKVKGGDYAVIVRAHAKDITVEEQ